MKTVGQILKSERKKQKKTIKQIHNLTKIPEKTLLNLENDKIASLPPAAFVKGFIRSYAHALDLDHQKLMAVFRRDWQTDEKGDIMLIGLSKPLNKNNFSWSPKKTFILTLSLVIFLFLSYLGWQIYGYLGKPNLTIINPLDNQITDQQRLVIKGSVNQQASVYINDELIETSNNGDFSYEIKLFQGKNILEIKAVNRRGKEKIITRKVIADF